MGQENATFHLFKRSGKWAYSGRGYASRHVWEKFTHIDMRGQLLRDNNEKMPGINGQGEHYHVVVVLDEDVSYGWPLHINAMSFNE